MRILQLEESTWEEVRVTGAPDTASPMAGRLGAESILIFETAQGLRGIERHCPHDKALLTKAIVMGGSLIRCPQHNFIFRFHDGACINCPSYRLRVFEVKREEGRILARPVAAP